MLTLQNLWRGVLFLGVILMLTQGAGQAMPDGMEKPPARGSDASQFLEELRSGGALKFYEDTEDVLRAGKSERAYIRYIFLNAHIRNSPLDVGLVPMVDQRLHFLREQMHLGEGIQYTPWVEKPARRRHAKVVCPPPAPKAAKPCPEEKPPEIIIPPAAQDNKEVEQHKDEGKQPGEQAPKAAPPPSAWEKIKRKLKFWQKGGG